MAGRQLPFLSVLIPLWMVRCMCDWKRTFEVWPHSLWPAGRSPPFNTSSPSRAHHRAGTGAVPDDRHRRRHLSLVVTAVFLRFLAAAQSDGVRAARKAGRAERHLPRLTAAESPRRGCRSR